MPEKTKVQFTYERNVRSTAEGEVLSAMLSDLGQLAQKGVNGAAFRKIYGSDNEVNVQKLQQSIAELRATRGDVYLIAPRKTEKYAIDARLRTAGVVAEEMEDEYAQTSNPKFRRPDGSFFEASDFSDPSKLVPGNAAYEAYKALYGDPPSAITEGDLGHYERLAELAADLGVSIDGVDVSTLPRFKSGGDGGTKFALNVFYEGEILGAKPAELSGNMDRMRAIAHRPGGHNYQNRIADAIRRGGQSLDGLARSVNLLGGDEATSPLAHVHKKSSYAVLRIFRGYAPDSPDPFGGSPSFEILFQTNRFLLSDVQESDMERMALIETFGDPYIYMFGSRARVWSYSGTLMDTMGLNWLNEWRVAYQKWVKGSRSTKMRARAVLCYDDVVREGVIVSSGISKSVASPGTAQFSFQMFVMREHFLDGEPQSLAGLIGGRKEDTFFFSSADTKRNVEERYDILEPIDVTKDRRTIPGGDKMLNAAVIVEDGIADANKPQIKAGIIAAAFKDGALVHPSGSFALDLSSSDKAVINRAAQAFLDKSSRLRSIPSAGRGARLSDRLPVSAEF